jgi:hypothetical protein
VFKLVARKSEHGDPLSSGTKAGMEKLSLATVLVDEDSGPVRGTGAVWSDRKSVLGGLGGPGAVAGSPAGVTVESVTLVGAPTQVNVGDGAGGTSVTVVAADVDTWRSREPFGSTPLTESDVSPDGVRLTT